MSNSTTKSTPVKNLKGAVLGAFKSSFQGELLAPGDNDYHEGRKVYNAMIDKQPGLIAYCTSKADVEKAVGFAREYKLDVAIRGGGHSGAGLGICEDGLCIDLSRIKKTKVNQKDKTVMVEGGCTWGEVDQATHAYGLALPSGIISTTGVGMAT